MPAARRLTVLAIALAALAGAAQAQAQGQAQALPPAAESHPLQSPIPAAASLNAAVSARFGEAGAQKAQGMARTSVGHNFDRDNATGSFGLLCGRPDSLDERAASSAFGADPHGRFLGAKLSLAFR